MANFSVDGPAPDTYRKGGMFGDVEATKRDEETPGLKVLACFAVDGPPTAACGREVIFVS